MDIQKCIKKWGPVIDNLLNCDNLLIKNITCQFCEWYINDNLDISDFSNILQNELIIIKQKINNFERIEIIREYFNPASGYIEYKLKNGNFIKANKIEYELSNEDLINLFGIKFIRYLDIQKFRDIQLNKIL